MKQQAIFNGKRFAALALALTMILPLAACGGQGGGQKQPTEDSGTYGGDTYKISVNTALSGSGGGYGEASRRGAEIAIQEINAAGGINGVMLEAIYDDNKMTPADAVAIAKRRFSEGVMACTVGVTGTTALSVMPLSEEKGVPTFTIGLATTAITSQENNYVYRVFVNDGAAAASIASYLVNEKQMAKIAIIHDQNDYGVGGKDIIVSTLKDLGMEPAAIESFKSGDVDFSTQLIKVKESGADALILWGMGSEMALLAAQSRELGMDVQLAGGGAMDNVAAYVDAAGAAADGTIFSTWIIPDETAKNYQDFLTAFQAAYNAEPESESILTYDAIHMIAEGLNVSGNDRAKLNDAIKALTHDGLYGTYTFNQNGDNAIGISIVQWEGTTRKLLTQIDPTPFYDAK